MSKHEENSHIFKNFKLAVSMNCAHFIIFRPKQTNFKMNFHETSPLNF